MIRGTWMSTLGVIALALAARVDPVQARDTQKPKPDSTNAGNVDPRKAETPKEDFARKYDELAKRFEGAQQSFRKKMTDAETDDEREKLFKEFPESQFLAEFKALAQEADGTDVAPKAWLRVATLALQSGDEKQMEEAKLAVNRMLTTYITSPSIAGLPFLIGNVLEEDDADKALSDILAKSPHKAVKAAVVYNQAQRREKKERESQAEDPELRRLYERLVKDYADEKVPSRNQTYKEIAEGWIFARDNLQVGKIAPDFESTDENGVKFKLSEYKGKVVVLDFWGFW